MLTLFIFYFLFLFFWFIVSFKSIKLLTVALKPIYKTHKKTLEPHLRSKKMRSNFNKGFKE